MPYNFINNSVDKWNINKLMDLNTITWNDKGAVLNGRIPADSLRKYKDSEEYFTLNGIQYESYTPNTFTLHLEELVVGFKVMEDRSILGYSD